MQARSPRSFRYGPDVMNASRVAGHGGCECTIGADSGSARNILRTREQRVLVHVRRARRDAESCWTVNGIVSGVTESVEEVAPSGAGLSKLKGCNFETRVCVSTAKRCMTRSNVRSARPRCLPRSRAGFPRRSGGRVRERRNQASGRTRTASCSTPRRVHPRRAGC